MPFLRVAMRNLSRESSAQREDFNLKRILLYRGNHGRLFQQNRSLALNRRWILSPLSYASDWSDRTPIDGHIECKQVVTWVQLHMAVWLVNVIHILCADIPFFSSFPGTFSIEQYLTSGRKQA